MPGDVYIYHRGNLAADRTRDRRLIWLAAEVLEAQRRGKVVLVQRKMGFNDYAYEARRLRDRDLLLRQVKELATI